MTHDVMPAVWVWLAMQMPLAIAIAAVFRGARRIDDAFAVDASMSSWSRGAA